MATVMITGANRGIGLTFVRHYLTNGDQVIATCRNPDQAEQLQQLSHDYSQQLAIHKLDVTADDEIDQLAETLNGTPIDILICNAGIYGGFSEFGDTDTATWLQTFTTNTIAPMHVCEALMPNVLAGNDRKVILMTSKMGSMDDNGSGGSYIYRSSKAALNAVGKSLANDLSSEGVVVLLMHPGWVQTDMTGPNAPMTTDESVAGMRNVIAKATLASSGRFWAYDGKEIPW